MRKIEKLTKSKTLKHIAEKGSNLSQYIWIVCMTPKLVVCGGGGGGGGGGVKGMETPCTVYTYYTNLYPLKKF